MTDELIPAPGDFPHSPQHFAETVAYWQELAELRGQQVAALMGGNPTGAAVYINKAMKLEESKAKGEVLRAVKPENAARLLNAFQNLKKELDNLFE